MFSVKPARKGRLLRVGGILYTVECDGPEDRFDEHGESVQTSAPDVNTTAGPAPDDGERPIASHDSGAASVP